MLYQFPPPDWFEPGTTSHVLGQILLWCIALGLPGSIAALWFWKPRTKLVWISAIFLWICALALSIVLFVAPAASFARVFQYAPPYLGIAAGLALMLLPLPAIAAGLNELPRTNVNPKGFREPRTWGCATATMIAGYFVLMLLFANTGHPAEAWYRTSCKNNLKQIGLAFHHYLETHSKFADSQTQSEEFPPHSWRVELLPFLKHQAAFNTYDQTKTWDFPSNQTVSKQKLAEFVCPSVREPHRQDSDGRWYSAYATLNGPDTAFPGAKGLPQKAISDGLSNTTLVAEACGQQIVWTEPRDIEVSKDNLGFNLPGERLGQSPATWSSYHQGGAHTLLGDGAVRFLSKNTDPSVLKAISTASGGETVGDY